MSNGATPFRVQFSERQLQQLRALADQASAAGMLLRFTEALTEIRRQLARDPVGFGDPQFALRGMDLTVFSRLHSLLSVTDAVDEARHIVYIRNVRLFLPPTGS